MELVEGERYFYVIGEMTGFAEFRNGKLFNEKQWWSDGVDPKNCSAIVPLEDAIRAPELQAENARLRKALKDVYNDVVFMTEHGTLPSRILEDVIYVDAREALKGGE